MGGLAAAGIATHHTASPAALPLVTADSVASTGSMVKQGNVKFGDVIQALRLQKRQGIKLKDALGDLVSEHDIMKMVRDDVSANYRPSSSDWRDSEII